MNKPKPKKCKGTHKDTYGIGCGLMQENRKLGLGIDCGCYSKFLRETPQGQERVKRHTLQATKTRRAFEKNKKEINESKSLPRELKLTQDVFNRYIRLRDKFKPCISSNMSWRPDHEAGHLFTVKQYNELRFDEDNVHGQSIGDNRFEEGNFENYLINLKYRIGEDRVKALLKRAEIAKQRDWKWSIPELKILRKKYNEKIKQLEQNSLLEDKQ